MNNLQVLVRCYDKVAQNPGFQCPTLTSACGYKQTSSRPKSTSAYTPKADILVAVTDFRLCEGFSDACRGWACAANSVGRRRRSLRGRNRGGD